MRRDSDSRSAFAVSVAAHALVLAAALALARRAGPPPSTSPADHHDIDKLVWLNAAGPGGGGGGGGSNQPDPPQKLKLRGTETTSVSAGTRPATYTRPARTVDTQLQPLDVPVVSLGSTSDLVPGAVDAPRWPDTGSQGSGSNSGAGSGAGGGNGPGFGNGLGPGAGRNTGGDVYRPGGDVTLPVELHKGSPQYTPEAVRARAQGSIVVACVVQPTGACTNLRVKRSMNPAFGLDGEAIKAAAQWRFRPGVRNGQPVPVLVSIEIVFTLR